VLDDCFKIVSAESARHRLEASQTLMLNGSYPLRFPSKLLIIARDLL
jgi:hypothetical protein